ncbi:MAG TPA: hypothetical protein VN770_08065 [Gaiellaceae bacterium]|nr:hypothetical protein [Gaiellaceae bacterium]
MSEATILSNAVFLPPSNPLRVLSFEQYAAASEVAHVKSVLAAASLSSGRSVTLTRMTDYTLVPGALASPSFDVLLVYDQGAAPAGTLGAVGQSWQSAVTRFVGAGGDVVVLDGASGSSPQMTDFLSSASLLQTTGEVPISPGAPLLVVASGDAVGNFVVSPYAAQSDTVCFVTSEPNGGDVTYVVDELDGPSLLPVVIHKTVGGP